MRLHVVSLPHTSTTQAYSCCAYTMKCLKFADMMTDIGNEVILYTGPDDESRATKVIKCITKQKQQANGFNGPEDYLKIDFNAIEPWKTFNNRVIRRMGKQIQPGDLICVITGTPTLAIARAFPDNIVVEFGVGYSGICHRFRVFESYAWRNYVYGYNRMDGAFYDEVIPNFFDVNQFPFEHKKQDYFLYIGRLTEKKGYRIAQEVCERLKKRLIVAGPGDFDGYGEYVGVVGPEERGRLMSNALAVFVPTMYVPPFEGVHIEANLGGTPVITTDFGVFAETVDGRNGYRCTTLQEFMEAAMHACTQDEARYMFIRRQAVMKYSTETVAKMYQSYFERLLTVYDKGWYTLA